MQPSAALTAPTPTSPSSSAPPMSLSDHFSQPVGGGVPAHHHLHHMLMAERNRLLHSAPSAFLSHLRNNEEGSFGNNPALPIPPHLEALRLKHVEAAAAAATAAASPFSPTKLGGFGGPLALAKEGTESSGMSPALSRSAATATLGS